MRGAAQPPGTFRRAEAGGRPAAGDELVAGACEAHDPGDQTAYADGDGAESAERPRGHNDAVDKIRPPPVAVAICDLPRAAETAHGLDLGVRRAHASACRLLGRIAQVALGFGEQAACVARRCAAHLDEELVEVPLDRAVDHASPPAGCGLACRGAALASTALMAAASRVQSFCSDASTAAPSWVRRYSRRLRPPTGLHSLATRPKSSRRWSAG